ncbi:hypothetical protein Pen01_41660 [Phytomonospora endophytica]|nr:hypothetical protein Pen01_41660 [Phytomonospora endophytica]
MYHYFDADPYDGDGSDLTYNLDERGWSRILLSAQPRTVS